MGPFRAALDGQTYGVHVADRSTRAAYKSFVNNQIKPRWAQTPLSAIKSMAVEDWLRSMALSPKTKRHVKSLMHTIFRCAERWELTDRNPIKLVRVKGGTKRLKTPRVLAPEQFESLLPLIREPYGTMVLVAGCLGLRVSEIVALQWGDFDFHRAHAADSTEHRSRARGRDRGDAEKPALAAEGILGERHGVFVTIRGPRRKLRGCTGTMTPHFANTAEETWHVARDAAFCDGRFAPVDAHELKHLRFEVSVLSTLEEVTSTAELDRGITASWWPPKIIVMGCCCPMSKALKPSSNNSPPRGTRVALTSSSRCTSSGLP